MNGRQYDVGGEPRTGARDLERLLAFVRERYEESVRGADAVAASWGRSSLAILDAMEAHLREAPPSAYELRRFLLRAAAAHRTHPAYEPHWGLDIPGPRRE